MQSGNKKCDIILAGVGGQGILSVAAIIGYAAVQSGLYLKQAETHGMSQRGGDVQSHLRISKTPIASDLIPMGRADLIISSEPMESLRYLPYLNKEGYLVTSVNPVVNIPNYPPIEEVIEQITSYPNHLIIDANAVAKEIGSLRSSNVVMLGAAAQFLITEFDMLEKGIENLFGRKGKEIVEVNQKALRAGRDYAQTQKTSSVGG